MIQHPYLPQTEDEIKSMLETIGVSSIDDLFSDIAPSVLLQKELNLPKTKTEWEVYQELSHLAEKNRSAISFLGCGSYDHILPSVVGRIMGLPMFYTSYTPYQAEISQGVLQAIFEFQSMICSITGMDVANASLYDGATAAVEAAAMAVNSSRNSDTILVSETVHPSTKAVLRTYFGDLGINIVEVPAEKGQSNFAAIRDALKSEVAAVLVQTPNIFGYLEDLTGLADAVHDNKSKLIVSSNPMSLGIARSQAEWNADIAVGDTQPFGLPSYFGGPSVGYIATREKLMRKLPGRIVGQTTDAEGKRAFVLTLQAREQHIKRERATSNICSNQALAALGTTIYLSLIGKQGLKEAGNLCLQKAHYLHDRLVKELGAEALSAEPFFNEFTLNIGSKTDDLIKALRSGGIYGGVRVENLDERYQGLVTIAVTEKRTKQEMDRYVDIAREVL
ncbi:aminomethyl-transferring glycine dehydrogenase subunit GcvPA [Sediminispirochaeta bajacaliforniensis]|uniref:aminomethyl-transferring glycine dehydrogenase subunit GcvPA n=1 Tax=Sediminispirochaeta bajacaliforniensis TaxID=148 RepID=UPI000365638E|nr:aminomethyl-transferring glycine dehydrogenase subunit GcvPA [Sediminispirochaeta bajacaliforniensis]